MINETRGVKRNITAITTHGGVTISVAFVRNAPRRAAAARRRLFLDTVKRGSRMHGIYVSLIVRSRVCSPPTIKHGAPLVAAPRPPPSFLNMINYEEGATTFRGSV